VQADRSIQEYATDLERLWADYDQSMPQIWSDCGQITIISRQPHAAKILSARKGRAIHRGGLCTS
jgi:hypothetical protein